LTTYGLLVDHLQVIGRAVTPVAESAQIFGSIIEVETATPYKLLDAKVDRTKGSGPETAGARYADRDESSKD
jgi:hypothetical protein